MQKFVNELEKIKSAHAKLAEMLDGQINEVVRLLQEARRPIFVWGAGMRPYAAQALSLARSLGVPERNVPPLPAAPLTTEGVRAVVHHLQLLIASRLSSNL
jgi:D-arabinose 5-phosphate isomerase GutQ